MLKFKLLALLLGSLCLITGLAGCGQNSQPLAGTAPNDILTFADNTANKTIVRIGTQYYIPDNSLIETLNKKFPDHLFVLDYSASAGTNSRDVIVQQLKQNHTFDLLIFDRLKLLKNASESLLDLSAENFLNNYLLSSLNQVSLNGHVYAIPGNSSLAGIAYNMEMFAEHNWSIPQNTEEFFELCAEVKAAGITPFSTCFKYAVQINRLFSMMCYAELYKSPEDVAWFTAVQQNQADYQGHMEPFYELAKRFYDTGVITPAYFTASLTQQRQDFWAGKYAMIDYDSIIYTYAESEKAPFTIGMMPYPAQDSQNSGFEIYPEYYLAIPKLVENDPAKLQLMKEVLGFLSSDEGQQVMLKDTIKVSNIKGISFSEDPAYKYVEEAAQKGNLYPKVDFDLGQVKILDLQKASIESIFNGSSVSEAIAQMDENLQQAFANPEPNPEYEKLAEAETAFTMLETSYYLADKLKEASGAEIGLMLDRGYFRSNLAKIERGTITSDLSRFVMKGMDEEDYLITYQLTGRQIKQLLEHPLVNETEIDSFIAASGLKMEYAPWNERGNRVLKVSLEDGSELLDQQLYTVAAFNGVIDPSYQTGIVTVHQDLGSLPDILEQAFQKDGTIRPDIQDRLQLIWPAPSNS